LTAPTVSILIPIWRLHPPLFRQCLASVARQRDVDPYVETIVCFDGTPEVEVAAATKELDRSGLRCQTVVLHDRRGLAAARNACAGVATGQWLLPLDHDDALVPDSIRQLLSLAIPGIDLVYSDYEQIDERGRPLFRSNSAAYHALLLDRGVGWDSPLLHSTHILQTQLVRTASFHRVGGFRLSAGLGHEVDFRIRLWNGSNYAYLTRSCYIYRRRSDSTYHTRYQELVADTCMVLLQHVRRHVPTVTGCCRLGKVDPDRVTHYGFSDAACRRIAPDWVDYDAMRLR
jgi:glycosyltransferase involved in cell wall biosynthesis